MAQQKYSSEEITHKLREANILPGQGKTILGVATQLGQKPRCLQLKANSRSAW